jgi:hypothetical protein
MKAMQNTQHQYGCDLYVWHQNNTNIISELLNDEMHHVNVIHQ